MAGSGGGVFDWKSPAEIQSEIRNSEKQIDNIEFERELSLELNGLLIGYNDRKTELVQERIDDILSKLEKKTSDAFDILFGGSVAKHTYVDGLSDIDGLLFLDESGLADRTPQGALRFLEKLLQEKMGEGAMVQAGTLAVNIEYTDGMSIQLLPALRSGEKIQISSESGKVWSEIDPKKFSEALSRHNKQCDMKLVPMIKLAKAINSRLPEDQRLAGYHMEALAINAFRDYQGQFLVPDMLRHFFEKSADLVKRPIADSTGQSVHVDGYLGESNSEQRLAVSHFLARIGKRMKNSSAAQSVDQWLKLFGDK